MFFASPLAPRLLLLASAAAMPAAAHADPFAGTDLDTVASSETNVSSVEAANEETDPIIITGRRDGYDVDAILSGTRTEADPQDIPQVINVVTARQIADQGLRSIGEVTRYVPGISIESGEGHRDAIVIRGQSSTADFFTDGLRDDVQHYRGLYNVERIEVLKGPNALLFGRGGGGGLVNRVTKRPFDERYQALALSVDSEGSGFAEVDLNAPVTDSVAGRLNATVERFDNFRDIEGRRLGINPTLAFDVSPRTRIDVGYEYAEDERDVDRGIPPAFEGTRDNPARAVEGFDDVFFGIRGVNRTDFDKNVADARLTHRFSDEIVLRSQVLFGDYDKIYTNAVPSSAVTDVDGVDSVKVSAYQDFTYRQNLLFQNDVALELATGGIEHRLLFGFDGAFQDTDAGRLRGFFDTLPADEKSPNGRETFVPLADPFAIPPITFRGGSGERNVTTDVEAIGLFVQDQLSFGPLDVIAGVRHDWVDIRVQDFIGGTDLARSDSLWSPRVGVVLNATDAINLYASWSRSFVPQSGDQFNSLSVTTAALEPEEFTNFEVGAKGSAYGLDWSVAAFRLDGTNQRATDPSSNETVLTGEERAEGVEAEVRGRIGKLSLAAGAIVQNAEITESSDAAPAGRQVADLPDFEASLWGRYDFTDRFGAGLGVNHRSSMFASFSNEVVVDDLTRLDGALYFGLTDRIGLQVNGENLLNADGIEFAHGDNNLYPVQPRRVRATLNVVF